MVIGPLMAPGRRLGGIAAAVLPARYWAWLERAVPVTSSVIPSAVLTFLAGAGLAVHGFLEHAGALASAHNDLMLKAATTVEGRGVTTVMPVALNSLAVFTFLLTPAGWSSAYLSLSGFIRVLSAIALEPQGDPLLSLVDWSVRRAAGRHRANRDAAARVSQEGPEVPDRIVPGKLLGLPDAELVIIASRRKPDWDAGTVVLTQDGAYRVGTIEERQIRGRLRTLYPLTEHHDLEVFRRTTRYELPRKGPATIE